MKALSTENTMTAKEIAKVLNLDTRTVQMKVKELFPELVKPRQTTFLNEEQVTAVKLACEKKFAVQTGLEKKLIVAQAMQILNDEIKELQDQLNSAQPKIEFFNAVTDSKSAIPMSQAAKVLDMGIGRNKLFAFLRDHSVLMNNNEPYQSYIDNGWFRVVEQKFTKPDGDIQINIKTLVYQKGLDGIRKLYEKQVVNA